MQMQPQAGQPESAILFLPELRSFRRFDNRREQELVEGYSEACQYGREVQLKTKKPAFAGLEGKMEFSESTYLSFGIFTDSDKKLVADIMRVCNGYSISSANAAIKMAEKFLPYRAIVRVSPEKTESSPDSSPVQAG